MKRKRAPLSQSEIAWAKSQRKAGRGWRDIAAVLNCDWEALKRVLVPGFAEERARQIREARARRGPPGAAGSNPMIANRRAQIPPEVEADRHLRLSTPVTLTALLCGDPARGQSALDKKRTSA